MTDLNFVCDDRVRSVVLREPAKLVGQLVAERGSASTKLEAIFHFVPGSLEFLTRYAAFVQALPSPGSERTILWEAAQAAIEAVSELGLFPITVDAHRNGFPVFVRKILTVSTDVLAWDVKDEYGHGWNPLSGPLVDFAPLGTRLVVSAVSGDDSGHIHDLFRTVVLSRCMEFHQLSALSPCWRTLAKQPC